jgi:hypothetical protein
MKKTILLFGFLFTFINTITAQFTQNFDSGTSIPIGWSVINGGDANTWNIGIPASGTAFSGTNVAQILSSATAHNDYLVSPQINIVAGVNDRVTFWILNADPFSPERFNVKMSSTTPTTAGFTTTLIPDTVARNFWTKIIIDLSDYVGQNIYEEVNYQPFSSQGGENYGWRRFEANKAIMQGILVLSRSNIDNHKVSAM